MIDKDGAIALVLRAERRYRISAGDDDLPAPSRKKRELLANLAQYVSGHITGIEQSLRGTNATLDFAVSGLAWQLQALKGCTDHKLALGYLRDLSQETGIGYRFSDGQTITASRRHR